MKRHRSHALRRRYGRSSKASVTKVHFERGRKGIGTRVVLEDGWTMTFVGPVGKHEAMKQARWHRDRGERSER
jgi:hypothetical protein